MKNRNAIQPGNNIKDCRIEKILGQGGFGITYLVRDEKLDRYLAVKEYFPSEFVVRDSDYSVHPQSEDEEELYKWGLERFLDEGKTLAKFKHPNIVRVVDYLEENNTAYILMEYEQGADLQSILKKQKTLEPQEILDIFLPLLDGLKLVHDEGFIHRDIKPANIFIRDDDSPVLIDFGSARQGIASKTKTLTTLVSPGYAPFEQYSSDAGDKQGPWTDIYSLGASMYKCLFGRAPLDAVTRAEGRVSGRGDPIMKAVTAGEGHYPYYLLEAIDSALEFLSIERPQSANALTDMLITKQVEGDNTGDDKTIDIYETVSKEQLVADGKSADDTYNIYVKIPITKLLVLGLVTLWAYPAYLISDLVIKHLKLNKYSVSKKSKYLFTSVYVFAGLLILSWIIPNFFMGYVLSQDYMLTVIMISSVIFYLNTLSFVFWATRNIKIMEKEWAKEINHINDFIIKWEKIDNHIVFFLITSLPIIFSPYFFAKVFYDDVVPQNIILLLPTTILILGGIFHLWGIRLLVNLYNQFLEGY